MYPTETAFVYSQQSVPTHLRVWLASPGAGVRDDTAIKELVIWWGMPTNKTTVTMLHRSAGDRAAGHDGNTAGGSQFSADGDLEERT